MNQRPPTVERKVYFYRAERQSMDGETWEPLDPKEVCRHLAPIECGSDNWYLDVGDGRDLCLWDQSDARGVRLRLGVKRKQGLPFLEERGIASPLDISEVQGILEPTHVVLFDDGLVGAEFNFHGPRISNLESYLERRAGMSRLRFQLLLNDDATEQLSHIKELRLVHLRIHRSRLDVLGELNESLDGAFSATMSQFDIPTAEIILRTEPHKRDWLSRTLLNPLKNLVKNPESRTALDLLQVRGLDDRSDHVELFDLLKDRLVSTRRVVKQQERYRTVDSDDMYRQIVVARNELGDSLTTAMGVT